MDMIKEYLFDSLVYIQFIPAIIGLLYWNKFKIEYKIFILVLWYSALNELFKIYYGTYIDIGQNRILTNIYNAVYFMFLFWLFYRNVLLKSIKKYIVIFIILYFVSIGYELFVQKLNYHNKTQVLPFIIGGIGIMYCVLFYFVKILNSLKVNSVYTDLLFWIATAHFIYYLAFTPFKLGENYFYEFHRLPNLGNIKIGVTVIKIVILSIGFIWSGKKEKL